MYLLRTLELAQKADSRTFPNPKVGAVIVHQNRIIGEGFHQEAGKAHAEVNAINSVKDKSLLSSSTLYVSLEPCNHTGKTPPCTELVLAHKIPKVVVGSIDPNPLVAGKGIEKLRQHGVEVEINPNPQPFHDLNRIFFANQQQKRPYIVLKWAQTWDGYLAPLPLAATPITHPLTQTFTHSLRAQHHAIMVGRNTATIDNPRLDTRHFYGKPPIRIVWDTQQTLSPDLNLFQDGLATIVLGKKPMSAPTSVSEFPVIDYQNIREICEALYRDLQICSILVEGGSYLLQQFISVAYYDEIWRLTSSVTSFGKGLPAPILPEIPTIKYFLETDVIEGIIRK